MLIDLKAFAAFEDRALGLKALPVLDCAPGAAGKPALDWKTILAPQLSDLIGDHTRGIPRNGLDSVKAINNGEPANW